MRRGRDAQRHPLATVASVRDRRAAPVPRRRCAGSATGFEPDRSTWFGARLRSRPRLRCGSASRCSPSLRCSSRIIVVARPARASTGHGRGGACPIGVARRRAEDPDELERAADEAERDGDLDRAVRLRFRAGSAAARRPRRDRVPAVGDDRRSAARARLARRSTSSRARSKPSRTAGSRPRRPMSTRRRREWPRVLAETTAAVKRTTRHPGNGVGIVIGDRGRRDRRAQPARGRASTARSAATSRAASPARRTRPAETGSRRTRRCSRATGTPSSDSAVRSRAIRHRPTRRCS